MNYSARTRQKLLLPRHSSFGLHQGKREAVGQAATHIASEAISE